MAHTASIAAGDEVDRCLPGHHPDHAGVAPAAWVMSYRVFYTSASGEIDFYTAEGLAALEDIVKDGADVLNNSWGSGPVSIGGQFDPLDQALINVPTPASSSVCRTAIQAPASAPPITHRRTISMSRPVRQMVHLPPAVLCLSALCQSIPLCKESYT